MEKKHMRVMTEERITMLQYSDNTGASMDRKDYDLIKGYILKLLDDESAIDPSRLFEKTFDAFKDTFKTQTGLYIYHVKMDLEARGLINHVRSTKRRKRPLITKVSPTRTNSHEKQESTLISTAVREQIVAGQVYQRFVELFYKVPLMVHAPGRINLGGDHTDYHHGVVLPVTIDRGLQFAIQKTRDKTLIYSTHHKAYLAVDFENLNPVDGDDWNNYIIGVLNLLKQKGHKLKPFTCVFGGDLPMGVGLGSSTALACGFVMALDELFQFKLSRLDIIQIAQWTERNFIGVKCGIVDPFACVLGKENCVIELDCKTLKSDYRPLDLGKYTLLICNTNLTRALANSDYNARREACESGVETIRARFSNVTSLRDVNQKILELCKKEMSEDAFKRCKYIIEENERVRVAAISLRQNDLRTLGQKMYETHTAQSELYEVSCPQLDFIVDFSKNYDGVLGCKMVGGGFGGSTVSIIDDALVGAFMSEIKRRYNQQFERPLNCFIVKTGQGASLLSTKH